MPKREDIKKIMLVGSGPIVIGQACEFDYSGAQACKALREEGYEIVLVNSNPATIMTDPEFADRTYIEPLDAGTLIEIIRRERPEALLPTLGGQTGLNLAMELHRRGALERFGVELLGAKAEVIEKAEDRLLFKKTMQAIGLDTLRSGSAHSLEEARRIRDELGAYPLVIRPGFTLGGTGGGIAENDAAFAELCERGLFYSPTSEILIEESVLGWKEFELEVMRDRKDNCVIVCSIENMDPMGVHTGDSITVAPAQTLTDREYQKMRDGAVAVLRAVGVETGGANVQFAVHPGNGRMVIIEMNPRVSRSSALASKATGFPIAKIAAKLAVGYTLDELRNDITRDTPACFEPSIDYVVTKIPRFAFEKFPGAEDKLDTQMKSVGETMGIGKTFKQSLQKALRSLETGRAGFGADGKDAPFESLPDEALAERIRSPNSQRIFALRAAFRRGWTAERAHELSKIDPWFLRHLEELAFFEDEIRSAGSLESLEADSALFRQAKELGYSDKQLAWLLRTTEEAVRRSRFHLGILPSYGLVDTCAAEFAAYTPYYYSAYGEITEAAAGADNAKKIMILGGGPNRIGQGIEFDYCCVHACFALREAGIRTIMVNSNPETVSTDYDTADKLYFEPLTAEDILHIYRYERCDGVIAQFGGQTPLNLMHALAAEGVTILGTPPEAIEAAEDRRCFQELAAKLGVRQPESGWATDTPAALEQARKIGYPVLVRPSFVLGGRAMAIVYNDEMLRHYMAEAVEVSEKRPVLIDRYLEDAIELDVDCVADGETAVLGAIMEHVEPAGVHSGDSACSIRPRLLKEPLLEQIKKTTELFARALKICGLMNAQYAVRDGELYVLEVNPRASRTVPFVGKATGVPLAKLAALCMAGYKLKDMGFHKPAVLRYWAVKEAVFPFDRLPGTDILLTPEMKSTGEVMGIDSSFGLAYVKSQIAAGNPVPLSGAVFISVRDECKAEAIPLAKELQKMGFTIYATLGTSTALQQAGIDTRAVFKISEGRPNIIDLIERKQINWLINIPASGHGPRLDEVKMRRHALLRAVPITTTLDGFKASIEGILAMRNAGHLEVCSLQEYHRHAPRLKYPKKAGAGSADRRNKKAP